MNPLSGLLSLSLLLNFAALILYVALATSPENMRRAACWLLAKARAIEDSRDAGRAIEVERIRNQRQMEQTIVPRLMVENRGVCEELERSQRRSE